MPDYSDAAISDALRRQMTLAAARQVVAASNLANANTPGYRAREVDFSQSLSRQLTEGVSLVKTSAQHLDDPNGRTGPSDVRTREVAGLDARRDGNTVQLDRELLSMTSASGDFSRAQTVLAAKFKLLRYAITGG
ncbi:MAG: flagellar basal body rod protein FlgB [Acidobacteriota bacterium]